MIKLIFKLLLIGFIISIIFWLQYINSNIEITIGNFIITTNIFNLVILLIIVLLPIIFIKNLYSNLYWAINRNRFASTMIHSIDSLSFIDEKIILTTLLKYNIPINLINKISNIKDYINAKNYDKAISSLRKLKVAKKIQFIVDYYKCILYSLKSSGLHLGELVKYYIETKHKHNELFFNIYFDTSFASNNIENLNYLSQNFNKVNFSSSINKKKYYCLMQYSLARNAHINNENDALLQIIIDTINKYPDFSPIYKMLYQNLIANNKQNEINKYLIKMWKNNPNFDSLKLYVKYYQKNNEDELMNHINSLDKSSHNLDLNLLLKAEFYIQNNKLIDAYNELSKILDTNKYKVFTQISLLQKEKNYDTMVDIIKNNYIKDTNFWNSYL